jgi:hypothetical protein
VNLFLSRRSACLFLGAALASLTFRRAVHAEEPVDLSDDAVRKRIREGFDLLDRLYWSPPLHIWLDRAGDDLKAYYEGRLNPPWWSCANAVETILDYAARSSDATRLPALAAMWEQHHTNADQAPVVIAETEAPQTVDRG